MKKLLYISLFIVPFFASCQKAVLGTLSVRRDTIAFYGKTVAFMGNSITQGYGASDNAHRWTTLFCAAKGAIEENHGIGGITLQNTANCARGVFDRTSIPVYSSSYAFLFIELGVNDLGLNTPSLTPTKFGLTYDTTLLYAAVTKGWPISRVGISTLNWFTNYALFNSVTGCGHVEADVTLHQSYNTEVFNSAIKSGAMIIDIYTAELNDPNKATYLGPDGLHPNDAGYAWLAATYESLNYYQ